jgi:DNA-binding CsgD family transcriptional regulator
MARRLASAWSELGGPFPSEDQLQIERFLAAARLFLVTVALLAVYFDPDEGTLLVGTARGLLAAYLIFAIAVLALLRGPTQLVLRWRADEDRRRRAPVRVVRSVAAGHYWIGRETVGSLIEALARFRAGVRGTDRPFGLTKRELQIVQLVAESWPNREIAQRLHISEDTVKHHLSRAFEKTGTSSRTELAVFVHHHKLGRIAET